MMFQTCTGRKMLPAVGSSSKSSRLDDKGDYDALSDDSDMTLLDEQRKRYGSVARRRRVLLYSGVIAFLLATAAVAYLAVHLYRLEKLVLLGNNEATTVDHGRDHAHSNYTIESPLPVNPAVASAYDSPTGSEFGDCGHSIEEAKAAGCVFDAMSWVWVAPACYHQDLIEDWWARSDWHFYTNWTLQPEDEVSRELVESGEHLLLYAEKKYHKVHCSYMWQKLQKTLVNHLPIDSNMYSLHHMKHCEKVLLNEILHEDTDCSHSSICPTQLTPVWSTCGWW